MFYTLRMINQRLLSFLLTNLTQLLLPIHFGQVATKTEKKEKSFVFYSLSSEPFQNIFFKN